MQTQAVEVQPVNITIPVYCLTACNAASLSEVRVQSEGTLGEANKIQSMSENISLAPNQLLSNVRSFYWPSPATSAASLQRRVYLFCLHPSPEDGASSTAAGVTSCEVTLQ